MLRLLNWELRLEAVEAKLEVNWLVRPERLEERADVRAPRDPPASNKGLYKRINPSMQMAKVTRPNTVLQQHLHISPHLGMQ